MSQRSPGTRDRISELMLELRTGYQHEDGRMGLRQTEAAALSGLTQSKISRAERGTFTLDPDEDAPTYATALRATPQQAHELVQLCRAAKAETVTGQTRIIRRGAEIQRKIRDNETRAHAMRSWQPTVVPGLLQTWDYTVALLEWEPDETWAEAKRGRMALLDDPSREFFQVLSEAALRWVVGSRKVMAGQMDHLVDLSTRPNIKIAIVPFGQVVVPPPESAFHLYGDRTAVVSTEVGTTFLDEQPDLRKFRATFQRLWDAALLGDDARALMQRAGRR